MYYVYLIKSISLSDHAYVGYTSDLKQRLATHNSGSCISTANARPWKIDSYFAFSDVSKAKAFEKYLKSHAGRIFITKRLI
ncbi:hypothetical protein BH09DEP1_BH09DEP1_7310 [soil metagenome]